jgi:hypothetical protein
VRHGRVLRVASGLIASAAALVFVLTSCPSQRDGMSGQLTTAKDDTLSAARSAVLALQLWAEHRSTRNLTCVQLSDARDQVVQAYQDTAALKAQNPTDLGHQTLLTRVMTDVTNMLNDANAAVRTMSDTPDPLTLGRRLADTANALERDYH